MFIKRAKSRPSLRARESDLPDLPSTSSPLSKPPLTADDAASPSGSASADASMDIDPDESSGSILGRKKAQKKDRRKDGLGMGTGKKATRLSFGGQDEGDEGEAFKPRKSLLSQQIKLPSTPGGPDAVSGPGTPETGGSAGIYSREYLSQLKAATPTRAPKNASDAVGDDDEVDGSGLSRLAREKYASSFVQDTTAGIPDATAIAAAKMKRQAGQAGAKNGDAAPGGGEEDYISLGGGKVSIYDERQGPHPESRLMREEDEEGEGDEDLAEFTEAKDKLYLGKRANKAAARRLRGEIGEMIDDREADAEDDEETLEWERAQAQRAGNYEEEKPSKPVKQRYVPAPIPLARPIPTISSARARLAESLADLELNMSDGERSLDNTVQELAALEQQERELRLEVEKVEGKREWTEEFRGWVEMLGDFLEEKFPKLEDIEADSIHHLKERAEMVTKRRAEDDTDDLSLFLGVAAPQSGEEEVDELGRVRDVMREAGPSSGIRRGRREEREARRTRRRTRTAKPPTADDDGFTTDSSLAEGDAKDYASAQEKLEYRVHALLDDVRAEDFRDPEKGLAVRFGGWSKRYEEEYVNAFGGLALVQAWEFWARGEMVGWEPLRHSSPLESFRWFNSLHHYSHPPQPTNGHADDDMDLDEEPPLGPDGDLVASMVSSAVVPLLTKAFEAGAYDPYSAPQTRRAVDLMDVMAELAGKDSRKFTALLKAILLVFHNHLISLSNTISSVTAASALPPPSFDPASRPAMERYVRRRIKLLKNMLLWKREAPQEIRELVVRLVGEVLRPVLGRTWEGGGREMAVQVLAAATGSLSPDLVGFLQQGPNSRW